MALTTEGARQRKTAVQVHGSHAQATPNGSLASPAGIETRNPQTPKDEHPAGPVRHGGPMQALRIFLFVVFFLASSVFIHGAQYIGAPLYFYDRDLYYAYMALTKQYFGVLVTTGTWIWSPTVVRISGDASMAGQLHRLPDGRLECHFPERVVLIANHQIYTDWLYLWWISYTSRMHGHIYIILKESLKWVPIIGPAMQFYNFIFMARKWEKDQKRMAYRLQKLNTRHSGPLSGSLGAGQLDPMWLLIFPEGTNLSANTRNGSARWAAKSGIPDCKHVLLPRSTGLQFSLQQLEHTVEYLYDCTIMYEGAAQGQYASDLFTLRSVYFQGRRPKSVNMHWRRFKISDIPIHDKAASEQWILDRWREKDDMMEHYQKTGRFPGDAAAITLEGPADTPSEKKEFIDTEVRPGSVLEYLQMFMPVSAAALIVHILIKSISMFGSHVVKQ